MSTALRERLRIIAWLRWQFEHFGQTASGAAAYFGHLADDIDAADHWKRWDECDEGGQIPPGTKEP